MLRVTFSLLVVAGFHCTIASAQPPSSPERTAQWLRPRPTTVSVAHELPDYNALNQRNLGPHRPLAMPSPELPGQSKPDLRALMRPRFDFETEWVPKSDGLAIGSYGVRTTIPTYPLFGPPPMLTLGFAFTDLLAPESYDLPSSLYDVSIGVAGMRKLNDRWAARWMFSAVFASDWQDRSSDAWRFRGGGFAVWTRSERWQLMFGAVATGREDIPVLPAAGAIWRPRPDWVVEIMMPRPRVARMIADRGDRQHWLYAGGGLDGGTWAYQRASGADELLTYREWRLVLGWEAKPPQVFGGPPTGGMQFNAEIGYVLGRTFEFDSPAPSIKPDNALLLRAGMKF